MLLVIVLILIVIVINAAAFYMIYKRNQDVENKRMFLKERIEKEKEKEKERERETNQKQKQKNQNQNEVDVFVQNRTYDIPMNMIPWSDDIIARRDRAVLDDALYPPLNRQSIQPPPFDTYRLIGYLVSEEGGQDDSWKLFARSKNNNQAQFYASSTNNTKDVKIAITNDMTRGNERLRDIYNLPQSIYIDHPLFVSRRYSVVENPQSSFDSFYF